MEGKRKGMKEILQEKRRPSKDNIAESIANRRRKKGTKWTKGGKRRENSNVSTLHQKMLEKIRFRQPMVKENTWRAQYKRTENDISMLNLACLFGLWKSTLFPQACRHARKRHGNHSAQNAAHLRHSKPVEVS